MFRDSPGGPVVGILPASAGAMGSIPGLGGFCMPWGNQACVSQLLRLAPQLPKPVPKVCAPQEKPLQWEACTLQLESSPLSPQSGKPMPIREDPAQPENKISICLKCSGHWILIVTWHMTIMIHFNKYFLTASYFGHGKLGRTPFLTISRDLLSLIGQNKQITNLQTRGLKLPWSKIWIEIGKDWWIGESFRFAWEIMRIWTCRVAKTMKRIDKLQLDLFYSFIHLFFLTLIHLFHCIRHLLEILSKKVSNVECLCSQSSLTSPE